MYYEYLGGRSLYYNFFVNFFSVLEKKYIVALRASAENFPGRWGAKEKKTKN